MPRWLLAPVLLLVPGVAGAAPCTAPTNTGDVALSLKAAEAAFSDLDGVRFLTETERALDSLPCVTDPVSRSLAARLHRTLGFKAFLQDDLAAAALAFSAARAAQPAYVLSMVQIPPAHPVRILYESQTTELGPTQILPSPAGASLLVDGRETQERLTGVAAVVQVVSDAGAVSLTALVPVGGSVPQYAIEVPAPAQVAAATKPESVQVAPAATPASEPAESPTAGRGPVIGAAGAAILAGVVYGVAYAGKQQWYPASATQAEADTRRWTVNGLVIGSGVLAATAVGLGATVVVKRF